MNGYPDDFARRVVYAGDDGPGGQYGLDIWVTQKRRGLGGILKFKRAQREVVSARLVQVKGGVVDDEHNITATMDKYLNLPDMSISSRDVPRASEVGTGLPTNHGHGHHLEYSGMDEGSVPPANQRNIGAREAAERTRAVQGRLDQQDLYDQVVAEEAARRRGTPPSP